MIRLRNVLPIISRTCQCSNLNRNAQLRPVFRACSSQFSSDNSPAAEIIENKDLKLSSDFYNKNPRALEKMGIAKKNKGWGFQYPPKNFYHRLVYDLSGRHTEAYVEHCSGIKVVSASTKEFAIAKHLYSATDVCASENIGRVIAMRCLEFGITNMTLLPPENTSEDSEKFVSFLAAVEESGVELSEPAEVAADYSPGIDYDNEEEVNDLKERQGKVHKLSEEHLNILKFRSKHPKSRRGKPPVPFNYPAGDRPVNNSFEA